MREDRREIGGGEWDPNTGPGSGELNRLRGLVVFFFFQSSYGWK